MKLIGKHTQEVADRIIEAFKEPDKLPNALAPIFIHRKDDRPCRRWSWHNQLLAALSGTSDARGIRQWNTAGRNLRKGCKAIWILGPCIKNITTKSDGAEETTRQALIGFRAIPVFAVEDTEGDPLPEDEHANWVRDLPLVDVAKAWGIHVDTYTHSGNTPLGYYRFSATGGRAIMLGTENLTTWLHELIHAADHRVGGLKEAQWHKEVVAELGAAILAQCLGQEHEADLGGAYSYIETYASREGKPAVKACIDVLDRTCECVSLVLNEAERLQAACNAPA